MRAVRKWEVRVVGTWFRRPERGHRFLKPESVALRNFGTSELLPLSPLSPSRPLPMHPPPITRLLVIDPEPAGSRGCCIVV